jgi:uncharacterized protein YajQ (UPF0234 family)
MADNHSFDIVSEINDVEMHNAVTQAQHEIAVRYDFKGTRRTIRSLCLPTTKVSLTR